jgi:hypothetical protein
MALQKYTCPDCGISLMTFKKNPTCNHEQSEEGSPRPVSLMVKTISLPQSKMMEPSNKEKGKSQLKDQKKILMERVKNYALANERDDFIQESNSQSAKSYGWLNADGTKRKKIDDL